VRKIFVVPEPVVVNLPHETPVPPPPVQPPKVDANLQPPRIVIPVVETVSVTPPPDHPQVIATSQPTEGASGPGPAGIAPPPQPPIPAHPPAMHTAVLADANACALPAYPKSAIRNEETGTTTLALLVGTDGRVTSARVDQSSGYRELDRAAVQALSLCQFKPATSNGAPEAGWAKLAYVWRLD
jgi:protein TonB